MESNHGALYLPLSRIVNKADLKQSDVVLEIGPGTGNLTAKILEKAKKVIVVELDPRMAAEVTKRFQGTPAQKRLDVILGDVMKTELPYFDVCISNTPYQVCILRPLRPRRTSCLTLRRSLLLSHSSCWPQRRHLGPVFSCTSRICVYLIHSTYANIPFLIPGFSANLLCDYSPSPATSFTVDFPLTHKCGRRSIIS